MRRIQSTQVVQAPVEEVWDALTDTARYPAWNPFVTELQGALVPGAQLVVRVAPPGRRAMTFRPTVTAVENGRRLEWLGRLGLPGVFDGRHSFLLEPLDGSLTRLVQREDFSGALVPLMAGLLAATEAGFREMNRALADEVAARRRSADAGRA